MQELNDSGGNYYGINQISKSINVGKRKRLLNGNTNIHEKLAEQEKRDSQSKISVD